MYCPWAIIGGLMLLFLCFGQEFPMWCLQCNEKVAAGNWHSAYIFTLCRIFPMGVGYDVPVANIARINKVTTLCCLLDVLFSLVVNQHSEENHL